MKKGQFKGYILEEVLAYLMRNCGYQLINKANNDPSLIDKHNGLNVKGRGTDHQIDVLGDLKQIPSFSYPIRLSIEAKFRVDKQEVDVVRNAIGILKDINENYFTELASPFGNRYMYNFVIFSTSGFSSGAIDLAIAHNISLIDLSDKVYSRFKRMIEVFTNEVFGNQNDVDVSIVRPIRDKIRSELYNTDLPLDIDITSEDITIAINKMISNIRGNKALVGMTKGGYMIFLYSPDLDSFLTYAKERGSHTVHITWHKTKNGVVRYIFPKGSDEYKLIFKLPKKLNDIISKSRNIHKNALNLKENHLGTISIYYTEDDGKDYVFNLNYEKLPLNN